MSRGRVVNLVRPPYGLPHAYGRVSRRRRAGWFISSRLFASQATDAKMDEWNRPTTSIGKTRGSGSVICRTIPITGRRGSPWRSCNPISGISIKTSLAEQFQGSANSLN